jgi:sugar transferase (PEP-CTERM/EpsH1 system associated)
MPRVLFITARQPYPLDDGWRIRVFHLIKGWREFGADVDLIHFKHDSETLAEINGLAELCSEMHTVTRDKAYAWKDLLKGLVSPKPFSVYNYKVPRMKQLILEMTSKAPYDVIQVEDVVMAQYLPENSQALCILDMHNVESYLLKRYGRTEDNLLKRAYAMLTARKLRNYEIDTCSRFDRVLVCSEEDRAILHSYGVQERIDVLPNGVDCGYFNPFDFESTTDELVFVGSMDYHANISGVLHFVRNILPLIREKCPEVSFWIVGKNPPDEIRRLADKRIVVTGMVADVRPYLARAKVAVVPLLVGGGTRLKILEAMASGKPVVATSVGAEGIDARNGEHLILADSPEEFARAVLAFLDDPRRCADIGRLARSFVAQQYDWKSVAHSLCRDLPALRGQG